MALQMDFVGDASELLRGHLTGLGYSVAPLSQEEVRIGYFNLKHRLISNRRRNLHHASGFTCPPNEKPGLANVEAKIKNGEDLRPHLSKGILKTDYSDLLLNDWGVYHLHLGTLIGTDGFVERTKPVLFARFTNTDAYLIDVKNHGTWSDQDVIRAIHANWPTSIEQFKIHGLVRIDWPGGNPPTNAEIAQMRRVGVLVMQEIGGSVYAPFGGGYATDGTSIIVVRDNDFFVRQLRDIEKAVPFFESDLRAQLKGDGIAMPDPVGVRLERKADGALLAIVGDQIASMNVGNLNLRE